MSVAELKERHEAATQSVNALRDRLKQRRLLLLDTDGTLCRSFLLSASLPDLPSVLLLRRLLLAVCFVLF